MRLVVVAIVIAGCRPPGYGNEPPPDAAVVDGATQTADAAIDALALGCDHDFRLTGYATATSAWMTGTFTNPPWGGTRRPVRSCSRWVRTARGPARIAFDAGTAQYKFIINGTDWILDPTNPTTVDDGMGHTNNAYTCVP